MRALLLAMSVAMYVRVHASGPQRFLPLWAASVRGGLCLGGRGFARSRSSGADGVITVLGQRLNEDGSPSRVLKLRALEAAHLWQQTGLPIIAAGGDPRGIGVTEAKVIRDILMESGVPKEAVILEAQSSNTLENAWFMMRHLPIGTKRVLLVTSDFHMARAAYLFEAVVAHFRQKGSYERFLSGDLDDFQVETYPVDTGCPMSTDPVGSPGDINNYSLAKRAQDEAGFIRNEVVQIGLKQHVWGVSIEPLPPERLQRALDAALAVALAKANCTGPP